MLTHQVHHEAVALFRGHDTTSRFSEFPSLAADLAELASPSLAVTAAVTAGGPASGLAPGAAPAALGPAGAGAGPPAEGLAAARLRVHERIMRTYKVFQP